MTTDPSPDPLAPYVPRIAARWLDEHASARHQAIEGSLVSADISGFTNLSERLAERGRAGAEEMVAVINGCFEEMISAAVHYGGDILKFGGDALLILFEGDDHAPRAAVACAEIRHVVSQPRPSPTAGPIDLSMSIGLHSGSFDLFLGRGLHAELIITGPAATETIRCESDADAGQILASAAAVELLPSDWRDGEVQSDGRCTIAPPMRQDELAAPAPAVPTEHLAALVPRTLLDHLDQGGLQGEVRQVTTAFIAFSGMDNAIATQGPRRVARTLEGLVEVVSQACDAYNIHWLDTDIAPDGGKIHLTAGAPTATADDDGAMLHAVRAILDTCPDPPLAAGVNHGNVFVGDVGAPIRRTLAAMGDSVNLAARLCGKAEAGQLVATLEVIEGAATEFDAEPLPPFQVKGKSRPILAGLVGQPTEGATDPSTDEPTLPLLAREDELAILRTALERAKAGDPQVVLLNGPGGIGKTRLAREVGGAGDAPRVLITTCDPYQANAPFVPFRDLMRQVLGVGDTDDAVAVGAVLLDHMHRETPELAPWAPLLAMPLGAVVPQTPEAERIAPAFRRIRLQQAVTDFLRAALTEPTVVVIEDIEWLDNASRDLLAELLLGLFDRPWCVVLTGTRAGDTETDAQLMSLDLAGLPDHGLRELALLALGDHTLHPHDLSRLVDAAAGNAQFLLELVADLRQGGSIERLPRTIEAAVTHRLDALAPSDLALLRQAAVVGTVAPLAVIREVLGDSSGLPSRWETMADFVEVVDGRLQFREPLYQRVAYDGLSYALRAELHKKAARVWATLGDDDVTVVANHARHAEGSGDHALAWTANIAAGDAMRERWAILPAIEHYQRALSNAAHLVDVDETAVIEISERLGDVATIASMHETALDAYAQALSRSRDPITRATMRRKASEAHRQLGDVQATERELAQAMAELGDEASPKGHTERAAIVLEQSRMRYRQGRFDETIELVRQALGVIDSAKNPSSDLRVQGWFIEGSARMQLNDPEGMVLLRKSLDDYVLSEDLIGQGRCQTALGAAHYYAGEWDLALKNYGSAKSAYERAGYVEGSAIQALNFGEICSHRGQHEEAARWFGDAKRQYRAIRKPLGIASATSNLGWSLAKLGRRDEGEHMVRDAIAQLDQLQASDFAARARIQLAEILVDTGRGTEAESLLQSTLDARPPASIITSAWRVNGMALESQGRREPAVTAYALAHRSAVDEGLPYEAALAAERLAALGEGTVEAKATELAQAAGATFARLGMHREPATALPPAAAPPSDGATSAAAVDRTRGRLDRAQERLQAAPVDGDQVTAASRALEDLRVEFRRGHYHQILDRLHDLQLRLEHVGPLLWAQAAFIKASALTHLGDDDALPSMETAAELLRAAGDELTHAKALANLAVLHHRRGDWDAADQGYATAAEHLDEVGETALSIVQAVNVAEIQMHRGDEGARAGFENAIKRFEEVTYPLGIGYAMIGLGTLTLEQDPAAAAVTLRQALEIVGGIGAEDMAAKARATLAAAVLDLGDPVEASQLLREVLDNSPDAESLALALRVRAMLNLDEDDAAAAAGDLRRATEVAREANLIPDEGKALLALSQVPGIPRDERVAAGRRAREILGRIGAVITRP